MPVSIPMPSILRRLLADKALVQAIDQHDIQAVMQALEDGADPNYEMFHSKWRERTGTRFSVKQWWGARRNEPIYGSVLQENYWRTPLALAVQVENSKIVDILLGAGANPWSMGNGAQGWARPSPMSGVFSEYSGRLSLVPTLDKHFEHVIASYHDAGVSSCNHLDHFQKVAQNDPPADLFMHKLKSALDACALGCQTPQVASQPAARPSQRF